MADDRKETLTERIADKAKDFVGLPPGRRPDGAPKPSRADAPRKTLTSDDAEDLPPHRGTGFKTAE